MTTETQPALEREELISGSEAIAIACALADVDVITAYPIRPYDTVMQFVSRLIANGELKCEYIVAESEHSQFEIVKHASAVGARVFSGSSGVGWFYAFEALAVTCGLRLPLVAMVGNRALDDPGAFGCEHNDALAVRDLGWMLRWVDTGQEAMDAAFMAWRVAEDPRVYLPCAISTDGAFLTHSQQIVKVPEKNLVDEYLPPYDRGKFLLHPDNPITIAPQVNEDWLLEIRRQTDDAMRRAKGVITEAHDDLKRIFGRGGDNPFIEEYMTDDADVVLVGMGTLAMPLRVTVRRLREQGRKVGFVRVKWFPSLPRRGAARLPDQVQGGRGDRPRLLAGRSEQRGRALQRGTLGAVRRRQARANYGLHRRAGRKGDHRTGHHRDVRRGAAGGRHRPGGRAVALDRRTRVAATASPPS